MSMMRSGACTGCWDNVGLVYSVNSNVRADRERGKSRRIWRLVWPLLVIGMCVGCFFAGTIVAASDPHSDGRDEKGYVVDEGKWAEQHLRDMAVAVPGITWFEYSESGRSLGNGYFWSNETSRDDQLAIESTFASWYSLHHGDRNGSSGYFGYCLYSLEGGRLLVDSSTQADCPPVRAPSQSAEFI